MSEQRKQLGRWGEEKAKQYLESKGYRLIAQNWRTRYGEIDIIMQDYNTIVFVEVRTRSSLAFGSGEESITLRKQQQLIKMAKAFLFFNNFSNFPIRFDLISIDKIEQKYQLRHLKNILS